MHINKIETVRRFAFYCHKNVNHLYDGRPYEVHLDMASDVGKKFIHLIPVKDRENVIGAIYLHDVIEDTRKTYNDITKVTNKTIADIVYALTNEKGKTRKERANKKYYKSIRYTKYATFVKLCDRIANIEYSKEKNNSMFNTYVKENKLFVNSLKKNWFERIFWKENNYKEMFDYLNKLVK